MKNATSNLFSNFTNLKVFKIEYKYKKFLSITTEPFRWKIHLKSCQNTFAHDWKTAAKTQKSNITILNVIHHVLIYHATWRKNLNVKRNISFHRTVQLLKTFSKFADVNTTMLVLYTILIYGNLPKRARPRYKRMHVTKWTSSKWGHSAT